MVEVRIWLKKIKWNLISRRCLFPKNNNSVERKRNKLYYAHRHVYNRTTSTEQRPLGVFNWLFNLILMFLFLFPSAEFTLLVSPPVRIQGLIDVVGHKFTLFLIRFWWLLLLLYSWVFLSVAIVGNYWIWLLCICFFSVHSLNEYFRSFFFVQLINYFVGFYFEIMTIMTNNTHTHTRGNKTQRTKKQKKLEKRNKMFVCEKKLSYLKPHCIAPFTDWHCQQQNIGKLFGRTGLSWLPFHFSSSTVSVN